MTPVDVVGTIPTVREPERHISAEVADTTEITKIDNVNKSLLRAVTDTHQSPPAPEILVQNPLKASPIENDVQMVGNTQGEIRVETTDIRYHYEISVEALSVHVDEIRKNELPQDDIHAYMTDYQSPNEIATDVALEANDNATGHQQDASPIHDDGMATEAFPVHAGEAQNNDHSLRHPESEIHMESPPFHCLNKTPTETAPKPNGIAEEVQDEASVFHDYDSVDDIAVNMAQEVEVTNHKVIHISEDRDTSATAALARKMTDIYQVDLDVTVERQPAALHTVTTPLTVDDGDHLAAVAVFGDMADAYQVEMDVANEQRHAAPQEAPDRSIAEQNTHHDHGTDIMDIEHEAGNLHGLPATGEIKTNSPEIDMMDMQEGPETPDREVPSTTEQTMSHDHNSDIKMDVVHEATEKHNRAALLTTEETTPHVHGNEPMDGILHEASDEHNTEMRDAPDKCHVVSAREMVLGPAVNVENNVTAELVAPRFGRPRSSALLGINTSDATPHLVRNDALAPVATPLNSQAPLAAQTSLRIPLAQNHMVIDNAPTPASAGSSNQPIHPATQVSNNNALMQHHRSSIVPAPPQLNSPMPRHNILTHGAGMPDQQRAPPDLPIPHSATTVQQTRSRFEQAPIRPISAPIEPEEPRDPWADQRVKVHKNKNRGRKKAEAEAKILADIIAKYSAPSRPGPRGIKRKLYIDHYGPDAYRERADGDRGAYDCPVHYL